METAIKTTRPFNSGNSQAVRVPNEYRLAEEELIVNKIGDALIYVPRSALKAAYRMGLSMITSDFMEEGRPAETPNEETVL